MPCVIGRSTVAFSARRRQVLSAYGWDVTLRVLLADDHEPTLVGITLALEHAGMKVVAQVNNGPDAVLAAIGARPDVALLDVHMPGGGGIAAAAEIAREAPGTAVVMLSGVLRDEDFFAALLAGARGFLLKDTDPDRLPLALEGVLRGEAAIPRTLVARLIDEFRSRETARTPLTGPTGQRPSDREWAVLKLLADGLTTRVIGERLGISEVTVRRHLSTAVGKLGVADRAAAVAAFRATRWPRSGS
jgi:DNA-binding NarL/FixJ family response regulator